MWRPFGRVVEDHALGAVHGVEALVGLVPGGDEEARGVTAGLARADEIDVGVAARECGMHVPGGVQADREAAQQAQRQARLLDARGEASRLRLDLLLDALVTMSADSSIGPCAYPLP